MNASSEVKVLVRSASNLSGRSIKRNLLHRNAPPLYSTWGVLWVSNLRQRDEDYYRQGRNNPMHLSNPSVYGIRHDRKVSLSKLGRSYGQPILFRMAKTLCITLQEEIKRETVRLADEPVIAMMGMDNITYLSQGALDASRLEQCVRNLSNPSLSEIKSANVCPLRSIV